MKLIKPSYYEDFHCVAGACPDTCCQQWDVEIDPRTTEFYRKMEGNIGDTLRQYLYEEDGRTYLGLNESGHCPLWQENGLCLVQQSYGHQCLSQVCQKFPRLTQDYGDFIEYGLEMSCPEAARIMLTVEHWNLSEETVSGSSQPEYDLEVMALLRSSRETAFSILQNQDFPVNHRLVLLMMFGYQVQSAIDTGEAISFRPFNALAEAREFAGSGDLTPLIQLFETLEILTVRWKEYLHRKVSVPVWNEALCKLAQYGVYRYYEQAVSDFDLVSRIKFIITYCIMTAYLGGTAFSSCLDFVQCFSKEIENDSDNMDTLLDGAYTAPALTDSNLLGLLLK